MKIVTLNEFYALQHVLLKKNIFAILCRYFLQENMAKTFCLKTLQ